MNDRHPSGTMTTPAPASDAASAHYASYGGQEGQYGDFATYGAVNTVDHTGSHPHAFDTHGFDAGSRTATFEADPLFGNLPGDGPATGGYDTSAWTDGGHLNHDVYAAQQHGYDTGGYDNAAWAAGHEQLPVIPSQATAPDTSGQWDASAWLQPDQAAGEPADPTQQWNWGTQTFDTGAYDATQWNADGGTGDTATPTEDHGPQAESFEEHPTPFDQQPTATFEQFSYDEHPVEDDESGATGESASVAPLLDDQEETAPAPAARAASRSRRRPPPKRSAFLTVAVPSACVMGVAGIAAASVGPLTDDSSDTTATASDATAVHPSAANNKLDVQLKSLSAGADDFADRASRTQERIDLRAQQEAEKKKAAAEAARKERLRPKYALPVTQHGLSAYFGQAGVNWMSVHTGIDFPVAYGTTVMAATDGTVRTQWNSAYGNMLILTDKDGTETWYCHLSTYRVASGTTVKAGDPIAYSGNSGNSTGPHLHFEVRPAGGSAIDPLPWLRSHGINPT
ncbi:M23 family metallopeptidase [Streptomyces sp. NPDC005574]|uniref:M23 family metallopeptidase n=1 Tax=Streptomyces sp. NPDC005574 TaxID=3156891 RepID=UPI0033BDDE6D